MDVVTTMLEYCQELKLSVRCMELVAILIKYDTALHSITGILKKSILCTGEDNKCFSSGRCSNEGRPESFGRSVDFPNHMRCLRNFMQCRVYLRFSPLNPSHS